MRPNGKKILSELRKNSRLSLVEISKKTKIPVSTVFDNIKELEKRIILKHTALLDYKRLNYNIWIQFAVFSQSDEVREFLESHYNVNSLYRINGGYLAECVFVGMKEKHEFLEELENLNVDFSEYYLIEELKKESFRV